MYIIGIIFLAKVSRLLLFTPVCSLILLGPTQTLQARGLWVPQHFPCIFAPETCGSNEDLFTNPTGGSPTAPAVQAALRVEDWPPNGAESSAYSHLQSHHSRSQVQGWPGLQRRLCFRREEKRFQSRKIMEEQIASFSPDLNNNAKENHEGCLWYRASRTGMCFWGYRGLNESWRVWPEEIMALKKWRTVGQVHIAQGPPSSPPHTFSEMILANIGREGRYEFKLVPHPGCAVDRRSQSIECWAGED